MLNKSDETILKGRWLEAKGRIQKTWGRLTNSDLEKTKGEFKSISGLLEQKYGKAQKSFETNLSQIFRDYDLSKSEISTKSKANSASKSTAATKKAKANDATL